MNHRPTSAFNHALINAKFFDKFIEGKKFANFFLYFVRILFGVNLHVLFVFIWAFSTLSVT